MVIANKIKQDISPFHFDILPKATLRALQKCADVSLFSQGKWYLAGGTALALQAGHRQSVDLDFFTEQKGFNEKKIEELLSSQGKWVTTSLSDGTLYGEFFEAKMSFIAYPFFMPAMPTRKYGTVAIMTPLDIAVMKIIAISQRGHKRDFFDLYWICQNVQALSEIIPRVHEQYTIRQNPTHILKSLVYFEDAESDPEPKIYFYANWDIVKNFFIREIPIITRKIMNLN
ncbi:MAG: nucleotidyl transferase AbiEii/AbiGii toxin family protein [Candidatus Magasanikbacteria bacterium]|nr:nucleotidyl transferase AbiEii/AbiGii toxin family protein [Candidatus Magasanikbacteria bacterium]